jgi:tRNA(Glu) U13 pseudouridine synthase TruD
VFWYEKKMLRHLTKYPNDYAGALRKIPKRIRRLYVHAYQAYVFNQKLQQAILKGKIPKSITIEGFRVPKLPELQTIAIHRQSYIKPKNFQIRRVKDDAATIEFTLARGEYASTLLSFLL